MALATPPQVTAARSWLPRKAVARASKAPAVGCGPSAAVIGLAVGLTRRRCRAVDFETDDMGLQRLAYSPSGWSTWRWRSAAQGQSFEINYVSAGPETGERLLLVHGFGASAYHWRYQVAELASKGYRVYSLCLLGYGWSDRAVLPYSGEVRKP